ncbi:hypothetical protein K431DRAFT_292339 [Polychaeton citri CBS 116435]|uniref:GDP/GTP exchange factor Sec2 N-terminal domain-containing protein n=1 Tax=Polychaeton citri CBS 116435 TaxID=1314669 RepID=A0A9P4QDF7_9PEZI|nr:hypothetical protein K431DRAFT_292339 [Polychaeton citri CBS 116435]
METNGLSNARLHAPHDSAHSHDEPARVRELEEEVSLLTEKVMESTGRFANYENEIRRLNALVRARNASEDGSVDESSHGNNVRSPMTVSKPGISRFGSFMYPRKPSGTVERMPPQISNASTRERERELEAALTKEQALRQAAEHKVAEVNGEIEELSTTLFQQANEMVATERRENAKLKERLQIVERRDIDRKRRLERLEAAQKRIDRARALLVPR